VSLRVFIKSFAISHFLGDHFEASPSPFLIAVVKRESAESLLIIQNRSSHLPNSGTNCAIFEISSL
jgi:hypothetical protein